MTNDTAVRTTTHQGNVTAKAHRALDAIETLAEQAIVPDPQFPAQQTTMEALGYLERVLFEDDETTADLRAAWWTAVGTQDALNQGRRGCTTFESSRPFIAMGLRVKIEAYRVCDPFAGLGF